MKQRLRICGTCSRIYWERSGKYCHGTSYSAVWVLGYRGVVWQLLFGRKNFRPTWWRYLFGRKRYHGKTNIRYHKRQDSKGS